MVQENLMVYFKMNKKKGLGVFASLFLPCCTLGACDETTGFLIWHLTDQQVANRPPRPRWQLGGSETDFDAGSQVFPLT